jgi:aryl-alcohol dehydrogenase-like predicted oxidoreductase
MNYRKLGRTGWEISEISFGAWAIGGTWGRVDDKESLNALHKALDQGVNFFDTADVYGDGHSEQLLAKLKKERKEKFYIATKAGRRLDPLTAEGFNRKNLTSFVERSLVNLNTESIDLLQLHCPPTQVYYMPEVFDILDDLVKQGKLQYYGVSVEKVDEAIKAIEYPNVQSVQIIFNIFRQRPADLFFELAKKKQVGILARLPLSSGMLTGKLKPDSYFAPDDHRYFNRNGDAFDRGETFSGLNYNTGLKCVEELKKICPASMSLTQFSLKWILMFDAITCTIPGAKKPGQVEENIAASSIKSLDLSLMKLVDNIYSGQIKPQVHHYW